jgi:hypothetical protein
MQLFSADTTMFSKKNHLFFPTKSWKNHPKKLLRKCQMHLFSLLPAQPKWPKQKNSCFKMWLLDQLYIELGSTPKNLLSLITMAVQEESISHNTCTIRNKWEKLEDEWSQFWHPIYDTNPCWKYEQNPGSPLGYTS